jgi:predicted lipoprotein with Yx(FWY)xxD motif
MRPSTKALLPTLALSLALAACGSSSSGTTSSAGSTAAPASSSASSGSQAVARASNSKLGATVLIDAQGMTVYHLSGESASTFLCTSAECEKAWKPVSAGERSSAIAGLGTVKRPDGNQQLSYKGAPLYTFVGDKSAGEANGQGVAEDGGTWSAVTTVASATTTSTGSGTAPSSSSSQGSGGESSGSGGSGGSGGYGY